VKRARHFDVIKLLLVVLAMTSTSFGMVRSPTLMSMKTGHSMALAMVHGGELLLAT
jgi:hypothetical protein